MVVVLKEALDEVKAHALADPEGENKWSHYAVIASFQEHLVSKQFNCYSPVDDEAAQCIPTTTVFKCDAAKITEFLTKDYDVKEPKDLTQEWVEEVHIKTWSESIEGCTKVEDKLVPAELVKEEAKEGDAAADKKTDVDAFYDMEERFKKDYGALLGFKVVKLSQLIDHGDTWTDKFQLLQCLGDKEECKMIDGMEIKTGHTGDNKLDTLNLDKAVFSTCKPGDKDTPCVWSATQEYTVEETPEAPPAKE